jgi:hypothetical protein
MTMQRHQPGFAAPAPAAQPPVTPQTVPGTEAELRACLASWDWRIGSGQLYWITTKGDSDSDAQPDAAQPFRPNAAQALLLENLHTRNVILKARQLGFSTLIEILALDHALFVPNQEVVIIAQTEAAAFRLFRKKVLFAYDRLRPEVRDAIPALKRSASQIVFANGSSIEVTTSARGGTPHFLHISEFGKIAATAPNKAVEITTGSLQGVPLSGFVFVESTAEGQGGAFYELCQRARRRAATEATQPLSPAEYRFHFFPWWIDPGYRLPVEHARRTRISAAEHEYFDTVEGTMNTTIDLPQRAWYIAKRDTEFAATPDLLWREYPATPDECWQASTEGKYLAVPLAIARREQRIGRFPVLRHVPVNSFWDLGASDDTAIWLHQRVGPMDRWIHYHEQSGAGYLHFVQWMEAHGYLWGSHFLPHDASQTRQGVEATTSPLSMLREMRPSWDWRVVPRVSSVQHGIDLLRTDFATYCFDEEGCKEGLLHLEAYSREWNTRLQCWADYPRHDEHSHAADALRQKAQGYVPGHDAAGRAAHRTRPVRRATGMTA